MTRTRPKILVAHSSPIHRAEQGEAAVLRDVAGLLAQRGHDVVALTQGRKAEEVRFNGLDETVVEMPGCTGAASAGGTAAERAAPGIVEALESTMATFEAQRKALNSNAQFASRLCEERPDVIIASNLHLPHMADLFPTLAAYGNGPSGSRARLVAVGDDFRAVPEFFNGFVESYARQNGPVGAKDRARFRNRVLAFTSRMAITYAAIYEQAYSVVYYTDVDLSIGQRRWLSYAAKSTMIQMPIAIDPDAPVSVRPGPIRTAAFLGNSGHVPNAIAKDAIRDVIAPQAPGVRFVIGGKGGQEFRAGNVESLGFVDDEKRFVTDADVYVTPVEHCSGTITKLFGPIRWGVPIVTTPVVAEGFPPAKHMRNMMVPDSLSGFGDAIRHLDDPETRRGMASAAKTDMAGYFSPEAVASKWESLLRL